MTASAADSDGSISKVDFYNGSTLLYSDTTSPYFYTWNNVAQGSYSLTAKAYDNLNAVTTSSPVSIVVNAAGNVSPTVSLTAPANNAQYTAPATVSMTASAADSDGSITKVDFYNGSTLLYSDTTSPYTYTWNNVAQGSYSLTAKAYDNLNAVTTSSPISIVVNAGGGGGADKYVTVTGAGAHNGTPGNEWTIYEAATNAVAGDTVHLVKGLYSITNRLSFSNNGTSSSPIVFIGEFDTGYDPETADGTVTSYLYSTFGINGSIVISGNYIILRKLNMAQSPSLSWQLINVSGDHVTIEDSIIKYLKISSGDHTTVIQPSAQNFTLRNSFMYYGGRTIIWGESDNNEGVDNILIDGNTFIHNSNHNAIQIMPLTAANPGYQIDGAIIRNNLFKNNTYSHNILLRHNNNAQIYNNVFLNSGFIKFEPHNFGSQNTAGVLVAYNTFIDNGSYILENQAMQGINWKNNLYLSTTPLTNYLYRFLCSATLSPTQNHNFGYNLNYVEGDPDLIGTSIPWYTNTDCTGFLYLSWNIWKTTYSQDIYTITAQKPQFVNEAENDFRPLNATAPQVGKGIPIAGITTDKNGNLRSSSAPTIGAYEISGGQ